MACAVAGEKNKELLEIQQKRLLFEVAAPERTVQRKKAPVW